MDATIERTSTRANEMIDPSLHVWGWEVPVDLFLGGLVAGMMIITGYYLLTGRHRNDRSACHLLPGLGVILLSGGLLALFLDLEHKLYFWRLYTTFQPTSPMSWGSWTYFLVFPVLVATVLVLPPPLLCDRFARLREIADALRGRAWLVRFLGVANAVAGCMLGIYTGILLSALSARPLWSSAVMGPLFLVSGLTTATALVQLLARDREEKHLMARTLIALLVLALVLIALFVVGMATGNEVHVRAVGLLLGGPYTAVFWVLVVGVGLVVPLIVHTLATRQRVAFSVLAPILVILGGLLLRFVVVAAGQASHWSPI